jgi:tetratricopeptide (TPR) repeat protein
MTSVSRIAFLFALLLFIPSAFFSQEDPARESGLPVRIGGSRCEAARPGATATLQGTFNVSGYQNPDKPPEFSVALYAAGAFVSRQRVKNGGAFYFYCVPDQNVFLVAEVDSTEISSYSVGTLEPSPQTNYQDIILAWSAARDVIRQRNEVISVRNTYERTKENQKRFETAMDKLHEKNGETTARMLNDLLEQDPNDFVAMTEVANIYCDSGRYSEAEPLYIRALSLKGDFINALFGMGRVDLALKNTARAIEVLSQAYKINPTSADINHFLGEAYLQNKQGSLAITYMRKAIEIAPVGKASLHLRIAWLYDAAGAKNLAAEEYKLFLQKIPNYQDRKKLLEYIAENSRSGQASESK